jgi:hypothetical protein
MRRLVKFLHTMGAIGLMGAMAALIILVVLMPEPTALEAYATHRAIMGKIAEWLLLPSLGVVLFTGLWSMAITRAFLHAGWVWVKLATGILVFKGVMISIQGPAEQEAILSAQALSGTVDPAQLGQRIGEEWGVLWVMMVVAVANVVLGVWRPRMSKKHRQARRKVARRPAAKPPTRIVRPGYSPAGAGEIPAMSRSPSNQD